MENRLEKIVGPLLSWFDGNARVLPWRENVTPYRVWISEIMLQQTRVEAVKPYYDRFMKRLPEVSSLAKVKEEELLKLWEGLGYYNRARNLQKAAQIICRDYQGELPRDKEKLLKLPGIGSYTAGAISSIAYGECNPAVDGNVLRVVARVLGNEEDVLDPKVKKSFEQIVEEVIPKERAGAFNQALMELGAIVCVPNGDPKCELCPLKELCVAHKENLTNVIPHKSTKKARSIEKKTVLLLRKEDSFAIQKRPNKGLLAGLYEYPWLTGHLTKEEVIEELKKMGISILRIQEVSKAKHIFTHKEWHMIGYEVKIDEYTQETIPKQMLFVKTEDASEKYPIPSAFAVYSKYLSVY